MNMMVKTMVVAIAWWEDTVLGIWHTWPYLIFLGPIPGRHFHFHFTDKGTEAFPWPTHITSKWQTMASSPDSPPKVVTIPLSHTIFLIMRSLYYSGEHTCGFAGKKEREREKNPTRFPRLEVGLSSRNVCELNRWLLVGLTRHHSHKSAAPDYRLRGIARGLCIHMHIQPHLQTKYIVLIPRMSVIDDTNWFTSVIEVTVDIHHCVFPNLGILKA